jgi:hypothetical protein
MQTLPPLEAHSHFCHRFVHAWTREAQVFSGHLSFVPKNRVSRDLNGDKTQSTASRSTTCENWSSNDQVTKLKKPRAPRGFVQLAPRTVTKLVALGRTHQPWGASPRFLIVLRRATRQPDTSNPEGTRRLTEPLSIQGSMPPGRGDSWLPRPLLEVAAKSRMECSGLRDYGGWRGLR